MKTYNELVTVLKNTYENKLALIYQWVKNDEVSFENFQLLIEWVAQDHQHQIDLDTWD